MTRPHPRDPRRIATETLRLLRGLADEKSALSYQRYFKEPVMLFGIDTPTLRRVERDLIRGEAGMPLLERFLRKHGPRIPRTTLRYAIERFPEPKRKALLRSTRGKRHISGPIRLRPASPR